MLEKNTTPPIFMIVLYTTSLICSLALTNKIILIHGWLISGSLATFPLLYFFGDVLAEIYGYHFVKSLLWYTLFANMLFSLIILAIIHTPYPAYYNNANAFNGVFGLSLKFALIAAIAIWIGGIVNAYIISKWKILVKGKYFWLRSLGSTAAGELINTLVAFPLGFGGIIPGKKLLIMIIVAYIIKIIYALILVIPATLMVNYYKKVKGIDHFDHATTFNPFSLKKCKTA